ncbi:MAG: DUF1289 domain-containing protein [Gammaproteobacteria bacterium]
MKRSAQPIPSPCVGNCCLDNDDVCLGCFRHLEEIKKWGLVNDKERLTIIQRAERRSEKKFRTKTVSNGAVGADR